MGTPVASTPAERAGRKVRAGLVISNKMQKTIVVQVDRLVPHPDFPRIVRKATRFKAHDEKNEAKTGDWVKIMETRPLSKDKRWRLLEIVRRGSGAPQVPGGQEAAGSAETPS